MNQLMSLTKPPQAPSSSAQTRRLRRELTVFVGRARQGKWAALQLQRSALPYLTVCAPLVVTSVLAPPWVAFAMGLISALALYRVTIDLDPATFDASARRGYLAYALPLNATLLLWCTALAAVGHADRIPSTAFAWVAVLVLCVAPACRWARDRQQRRLPLRWTFGLVAGLALTAQGMTALADLGWLGGPGAAP